MDEPEECTDYNNLDVYVQIPCHQKDSEKLNIQYSMFKPCARKTSTSSLCNIFNPIKRFITSERLMREVRNDHYDRKKE